MGAYGAAILAHESATLKEKDGKPYVSSILKREELDSFTYKTRSYRCHKCGNNCMITMQIFPDNSRHFTGNRCEKVLAVKLQVQTKTPTICIVTNIKESLTINL